MNEVQPIRDKNKIEEMKIELLKNCYRDFILFLVGINTGLRISDLLKLIVKDVKNKTHIILKEQKTGKIKKFFINSQLREEIDKYIQGMEDKEYLFKSQKGNNKPISRVQAYRILNNASEKIGLKEIGTHTLRKTWGYHAWQKGFSPALIMETLNHSNLNMTKRYLGIRQDEINDLYGSLNL